MSKNIPAWKFALIAKAAVVNYANAHALETNTAYIDIDDVDAVWMQQTETVSRAILTVIPPNGSYYEVAYNGDRHTAIIEVFTKSDSGCVKL